MLYHQEMESRLTTAQALLAGKDRANAQFATATNVAYLKPMFSSVWASMLAAFRYLPCVLTVSPRRIFAGNATAALRVLAI